MPHVSIDFTQPVPLFPLPNVVLLPHATIPLHIFEPRYRAMVNAALDSRGLIAMASFKGDDWKQQYEGNPPLREHVCVGYIVKHQRLEDGRYNILLQGVCRAAIENELDHDPYRMAVVKPTEMPGTAMEIDLEEEREELELLLGDPLLQSLASISAIQNWISSEIPTPTLTDLAIMTVCDSVEQRYRMLCEADPKRRIDWLCSELSRTRQTLATAQRYGNGKTEDGFGLN